MIDAGRLASEADMRASLQRIADAVRARDPETAALLTVFANRHCTLGDVKRALRSLAEFLERSG